MNEAAAENYRRRMARVLDHIDRHPDGDLTLTALAGVAAFSRFHFHRQFAATFGLSVQAYVSLSRLGRAAFQLACRPEMSVTAVALGAGYQTPDSFARAFRKAFGVSPSAFRASPDWSAWHAATLPQVQARKHAMHDYQQDEVSIVEIDEIPILFMRHDGAADELPRTVARFIAWRRAARLGPDHSRTFTLYHGDPDCDGVPSRIDLACSAPPSIAAGEGMERGIIPRGRYARLPVRGPHDDLEAPANWLYLEWLPRSGEELRDVPLLCERSKIGPRYEPHEMVTELLLPLA